MNRLYVVMERICLVAVALVLFSCQKDDFVSDVHTSDGIEFSFSMAELSRAHMDENGAGSFEEGDKVGLYIGYNPARHYVLTLTDGIWLPKIPAKEFGSGEVTVNAYYPARENDVSATVAHTHVINTDQRTEGYAASDILWSHGAVDVDALKANRIELPFYHGLHRLKITMKSETGELPEDLAVAVNGQTDAVFPLNSAQVETGSASIRSWIIPQADSGRKGVYYAVVLPSLLSDLKSEEGWIRISANGKDFSYHAPDGIGGHDRLLPGKMTSLNLNLKAGNVEPEPDDKWANRKVWVYGIDAPVCDDETVMILPPGSEKYEPGKWVNFRSDWGNGTYFNSYRLPWKEGCGWYDCNKTYAWDNAKDRNMCWAASSSNILHWWMKHNAPYIEAYDQEYGHTDYFQKYKRPSPEFYPYPKPSEIFDLYIRTFKDQGAGEGINWFVSGSSGYGMSPMLPGSGMEDFHGFFTEVFSKNEELYEHNAVMSKERFNAVLKDALENRKAMAFIINMSNGSHNMNIWGAEFDADGYVSHVYYVDNNPNGDPDPGGAACFRGEISYRNDPGWSKDQAYVANNRIVSVGTVGLKRDVWKRAFPKVVIPEK